jgi:hypothetical protein
LTGSDKLGKLARIIEKSISHHEWYCETRPLVIPERDKVQFNFEEVLWLKKKIAVEK